MAQSTSPTTTDPPLKLVQAPVKLEEVLSHTHHMRKRFRNVNML
jgi:hypothetical protein